MEKNAGFKQQDAILKISYPDFSELPKPMSESKSHMLVLTDDFQVIEKKHWDFNPRRAYFRQNHCPGTAFQCKTPAPGSKNETKIPTSGHNFPSSNAKRSMEKEHYSNKSSFFPNFP